jgi:hypothetical protein
MGTPRKRISEAQPAQIGAFAVMRHKADLKACHFVCLHETHESAMNEAKRLASVTIEEYGADLQPFCFYVVEFVGRVGLINGALQASH